VAAGTLKNWWRELDAAPPPLTRNERLVIAVLSVAGALSRLAAISLTPWDWDEAQVMTALRTFDVAMHHPHPPGFPLFIGAAKLLTLAGVAPFRALQTIVVLAAIAIVPAMFFLAREARLPFDVSSSAAVLLAFFPNVWFYGGTAFSDVPAMTLIVVAIALLLRGCRGDAAFIGGAIVLAISAGVRPQNLVIGAIPFVIAAFHRRSRTTVIASVLVLVIVTVTYAIVIHQSEGWAEYRNTLEVHGQYITRTDSFRSPSRPALWRVFDDFFIRPYRAPLINTIVSILAMVGVVFAFRRRAGTLVVLASFVPFCVFAWLILDRFSVSRFSIGYAPLIALLAAEGAFALRRVAGVAIVAVLTTLMIVWTWPALHVVRTTASPPAAAIDYVREHYDPATSLLDVQTLMKAFTDAMLPDYSRDLVDPSIVPLLGFGSRRSEPFIREGSSSVPEKITFSRAPGRLWWLARQRYFDVSVIPVQKPQFDPGWYDEETDGIRIWRWMRGSASVVLPPSIRPSRITLRLHVPRGTSFTVTVGHVVLERMTPDREDIARTYEIAPSESSVPLTIETDRTVNPARVGLSPDARDLGLRLDAFQLQLEVDPQRHPGLDALPVLRGR